MGHLLGDARVSTLDQHPDLQLDALTAAGCYRVFVDKASGALDARPELSKVLDQLRPGRHLGRVETRPPRTLPPAPAGDHR
jgi:DNA invertase Pin-like site-specific DNA recombinase